MVPLSLKPLDANIVVSFEVYFVAGFRAVGFLGNQPDAAFKGVVSPVEFFSLRQLTFGLFNCVSVIFVSSVFVIPWGCSPFGMDILTLKSHYIQTISRDKPLYIAQPFGRLHRP